MSTEKNSTPVPNQFIDVYMKSASGLQIKVYLYLLHLRTAGKQESITETADELGLSAADVRGALSYWKSRGLLPAESGEKRAAGSRREQERARLLSRVEQYVGKPLSVSEMQTVYYISEDLHFSDELTDYLFQYCVDRGKRDFRYIEKTAVHWAEEGISNPRQAQQHAAHAFAHGESAAANKFNHFEQNTYDFDELERELLAAETKGDK